ncbi:GNAT family N-acetyltransferase [Henriciella aquimarina]|uniref:GNAT family N-acetyltransferase n=1 Tax=Henriciella aquimarina TaxID=545261 RepID=UPI0009FCD92D|nr:GNAT family protein [Henriciella aquimarina]
MELAAPGLDTRLIRLEPLGEHHRDAVHESGAVEHMWSSMPLIPAGTSIDAYFDHTLRMAELGNGLGLAVMLKRENRLVGLSAFLQPNRLHRRVQIGYIWLEQAQRGTGLVNHIQYLMLKRALEWRARRVEWWFASDNERAIGNVERLGALREGVLRQHSRFADGRWVDLVILSLVGEEIRTAMHHLGASVAGIAATPSA